MSESDLIDVTTFSKSVSDGNWTSVSSCIVEGMKRLVPGNESEKFPEILSAIINALRSAEVILNEDRSADVVNAVTECFRFLRNASAGQKVIQNALIESNIYEVTSEILECLLNKELRDETLVCVKVCVQFIGNSVVGNPNNQIEAWKTFSGHFCKLFSSDDVSLSNCTCMVFFNILLGKVDGTLKNIVTYLPHLLNCYVRGSEFAAFSVEYILQQDSLLEELYPQLESNNRLKLLDAVLSLLMCSDEEKDETNESIQIPLSSLLFLVEELKKISNSILRIVENGMSAEPRETLRLIDVVACASSRSQYLTSLQADSSLLINIAYLLKNINDIGRIGEGNVFTSAQRLSDLSANNKSAQDNPIFGFKASLVRLLGNLCHRHLNNQNQVRELGCLPAVLDTCNIDAYNPLLLQWSVLAVRNLLEDNAENQEIVASLISQGPASSVVLHELGLELHQDEGGKICVAPLKRS